MSDRKLPTLDLAVLCTHFERDSAGLVFSLHEPLHTIFLEPDEDGDLVLPELHLFAVMFDEDANGTFGFRVQVRSNNVVISDRQTDGLSVTFASRYHPPTPFEHVFTLRGIVLPAAGWYDFHVMCNHVSLSDRPNSARPPRLRVIRTEPGGGDR